MKPVHIYVLIDPITLKVRYIGRTRSSLKKRLCEHISKTKLHKKTNKKLTHKENWILKLLKFNSKPYIKKVITLNCSWEESHKLERELISKYRDSRNLTNSDDLGPGRYKLVSKEQKKSISKTLKEGYRTGRIKSFSEKEVYCYNLQGDFVKKFDSVKQCSEELNISKSSITRILKKKYLQCKGYRFYYKKQESITYISNPKATRNQVKLVFKDGSTKTFISLAECLRFYNFKQKNSESLSTYIYKRLPIEKLFINNKLYSRPIRPLYKGFVTINNKIIAFETLKELGKILGLKRNSLFYKRIIRHCQNNNIKIKFQNLPT